MIVEIQHFKNKFHPRTTLKNICTVQDFLIFGLTHTESTLPYADYVLTLLQYQLQLTGCRDCWVLEGKKPCRDIDYWYCLTDLEFHCTKGRCIKNEQKAKINGKKQARQQLYFFPREFLSGVDCQFGLFPYSLWYPHSFVADLPIAHSEDAQIICYYEANINCA